MIKHPTPNFDILPICEREVSIVRPDPETECINVQSEVSTIYHHKQVLYFLTSTNDFFFRHTYFFLLSLFPFLISFFFFFFLLNIEISCVCKYNYNFYSWTHVVTCNPELSIRDRLVNVWLKLLPAITLTPETKIPTERIRTKEITCNRQTACKDRFNQIRMALRPTRPNKPLAGTRVAMISITRTIIQRYIGYSAYTRQTFLFCFSAIPSFYRTTARSLGKLFCLYHFR